MDIRGGFALELTQPDQPDFLLVRAKNACLQPAKRQRLAGLRNITGLARYHARDGSVFVILELDIEQSLDLVDLGRAEDVPVPTLRFDDLDDLFVRGVFVFDLPD